MQEVHNPFTSKKCLDNLHQIEMLWKELVKPIVNILTTSRQSDSKIRFLQPLSQGNSRAARIANSYASRGLPKPTNPIKPPNHYLSLPLTKPPTPMRKDSKRQIPSTLILITSIGGGDQ
ncbi:hypothetical protein SESBI_44354 [Sesbania bispinosa]|nr:hypothetical protein SESBI_44354 [Sesbania bispinosa]